MTTTTQDSGQDNESGTGASAKDRAAERGRLAAVGEGAAEAYRAAREKTSSAYEAARERAGGAYESARVTAADAGRRAAEGIESAPMAAVLGGLALGAVAAAFLPRTKREEELLGPVGRRINETAREAARAARDSAREQIDDLGLSKDAVRRKLDQFTDRAVGAVRSGASGSLKIAGSSGTGGKSGSGRGKSGSTKGRSKS